MYNEAWRNLKRQGSQIVEPSPRADFSEPQSKARNKFSLALILMMLLFMAAGPAMGQSKQQTLDYIFKSDLSILLMDGGSSGPPFITGPLRNFEVIENNCILYLKRKTPINANIPPDSESFGGAANFIVVLIINLSKRLPYGGNVMFTGQDGFITGNVYMANDRKSGKNVLHSIQQKSFGIMGREGEPSLMAAEDHLFNVICPGSRSAF